MSLQPRLEVVFLAGVVVGLVTYKALSASWWSGKRARATDGKKPSPEKREIAQNLAILVGNTPLLYIRSLSEETGCEILAKVEFLNPGGSIKDRVAAEIIRHGLESGELKPGGQITEGTAGSTGISLAMMAQAAGCKCFIAMPDDAAMEKSRIMQALGAEVSRQRPVSITHPGHFVNVARAAATTASGSMFADQFETAANFEAHLKTGREIWRQCGGRVDAFVCGAGHAAMDFAVDDLANAGTGGTIGGVSHALKSEDASVKVFLVDPPGSGLYNKVTRGVMYAREEAEQTRLRNPADTITEGVGINRVTANFARAKVDGALKCSDHEAVEMGQYLLRNEGLFVGSSSSVNCVGAVKAARRLPRGSTVVTVLCDSGERHLSKFHDRSFLADAKLSPTATGRALDFVK